MEHKNISISDLTLTVGHLKKVFKIKTNFNLYFVPTPRVMWVIADICNV